MRMCGLEVFELGGRRQGATWGSRAKSRGRLCGAKFSARDIAHWRSNTISTTSSSMMFGGFNGRGLRYMHKVIRRDGRIEQKTRYYEFEQSRSWYIVQIVTNEHPQRS